MTLARAAKVLRRRLLWLERRVAKRPADQPALATADVNEDGVMAEIEALRAVLAMFPEPAAEPQGSLS